ncbi:MAG: response regulator [Planctomycetota bacterium]|nr:MAG: response regulator [Planctomycetota bacterium]
MSNAVSPRRLLLVEDSSTMRRMISTLLGDEGYVVETAVDGVDGLAKARAKNPELILTDYEMPEMDGPGLCRALKEDPILRTTPVIMLTTLGATDNKLAGLTAGADDYIQKPKSPDEIRELFARIKARFRIADLSAELTERNRLLESAHKKLTFELDLARKVQAALMPKPPKPRGVLKMSVRYKPANQLGGDVYDFYRLDKERLGILVADISGHGVNSAMLSGMVKSLASSLSAAVIEPGELMAGLDVQLENYFPDGYFCTGLYLIADESTGLLRYAGVGHPPAVIVGPEGIRTLDSNPGLLGVGMVDGTSGGVDRLQPGESLLIYTDGLPDAATPTEEMFGQARIEQLMSEHMNKTPDEILNAIEKVVAAHVHPGSAADDINLVLIQYPPE